MEAIEPTHAPEAPALRAPNWILRGTFLLGGGLWLLYPVAPQLVGLVKGEPVRWVYLWAWLPMWLFVGLAWGIHKQLQAAQPPVNSPSNLPARPPASPPPP